MICPTCKKRAPRKHCESPTCTWGVCIVCDLLFDSKGRSRVWKGAKK